MCCLVFRKGFSEFKKGICFPPVGLVNFYIRSVILLYHFYQDFAKVIGFHHLAKYTPYTTFRQSLPSNFQKFIKKNYAIFNFFFKAYF